MKNNRLGFILLIGLSCACPVYASSIVTITALTSPVWILQDGNKTRVSGDSIVNIGDLIITGDKGQVEMQLWSNATLQLNSNSEITMLAASDAELSRPDDLPELHILKGRACIEYNPQHYNGTEFKLSLGNKLIATIHQLGDICVLRQNSSSSIKLRAGSVQATHTIDPNMIILSEPGTELRVDDDGSFNLLFPGIDESLTPEIEMPFNAGIITGEEVRNELVDDGGDDLATDDAIVEQAVKSKKQSDIAGYSYTVYLFSTRSADVAKRVNEKFRKAGYDTQIYTREKNFVKRHRIVVAGFNSLQAAQQFAASIVGSLGIADTWIGKDR